MNSLRVGIACNIRSDPDDALQAEFDEPQTVEAITAALQASGVATVLLDAADDFPRHLRDACPDIVFNIAEGIGGRTREAQIPAILDYYGVPYTGSDATALAISLDKAATKRIAQGLGVDTPGFAVVGRDDAKLPVGLAFPVIVKPNAEGSGLGIGDDSVAVEPAQLPSLVKRTLDRCGGNVLVEEFVDGREFTVGLIGNGSTLRVLTPMEVVFRDAGSHAIYCYEVKKHFQDHVTYRCPASIASDISQELTRDAAAIFDGLGCRDFARADFRVAPDGKVCLLEINPLPGLAPGYSDFPILAAFNGIGYDALIRLLLQQGLDRYGLTG